MLYVTFTLPIIILSDTIWMGVTYVWRCELLTRYTALWENLHRKLWLVIIARSAGKVGITQSEVVIMKSLRRLWHNVGFGVLAWVTCRSWWIVCMSGSKTECALVKIAHCRLMWWLPWFTFDWCKSWGLLCTKWCRPEDSTVWEQRDRDRKRVQKYMGKIIIIVVLLLFMLLNKVCCYKRFSQLSM